MFQRKKWWEVASSEEENNLFKVLSRSKKYNWRKMDTVAKELGICDEDEFNALIKIFVKNRIILVRKTDKGMFIGYWENVENEKGICVCNQDQFEDTEEQCDPNVI
jgi:hypothetical protein